MKKVTLIFLILFFIITGALGLSMVFSKSSYTKPNQESIVKKPTTNSSDEFIINSPNIQNLYLSSTESDSSTAGITLEQLSIHNTPDDCYLGISGNVYDVSNYISMHPGGRRTITNNCGKEVTSIFARIHSNRAWDILKNYKIDTLSTTTSTNASDLLDTIKQELQAANPDAEIIDVRPQGTYFLAKILLKGKLYEVHINENGQIFNEEVEFDEPNWNAWQDDNDDR